MAYANGQYEENTFTPVVKAMELSDYVFHITDNKNKFPEYVTTVKNQQGVQNVITELRQDSLINKVRSQAFEIYMDVFTANEININKYPERRGVRLNKQLHAIELCNRHLATIQLCRKTFHLSYRRIRYWGGLVIDLREIIERWHMSDKDRYKDV